MREDASDVCLHWLNSSRKVGISSIVKIVYLIQPHSCTCSSDTILRDIMQRARETDSD